MKLVQTLCLALGFFSVQAFGAERPELELERVHFALSKHELSGIALLPNATYIVSDENADHYIYQVIYKENRFLINQHLDLHKLKGWSEYAEILTKQTQYEPKDRRLDLEGIVACGTNFYLANERVRHILIVDTVKNTIQLAPIDFSVDKEVAKGEVNAGFEGIAADCANNKLYIGKERQPREIITVDMKTWKILDHKNFPGSERTGQKAINFITGQGLIELSADLGDIYFENGFLYVLERNNYEVTKVDPKNMEVIARVSYYFTARNMYSDDEPFGTAEALLLTKDHIIIGEDNNGEELGAKAKSKYGVSGPHPALYFFKRPKDF